jgi:hypothetical protein
METGRNKPNTNRPGIVPPELPPTAYTDQIEDYSPERVAEFLLNNAVGAEDYAAALEEVRRLGIDPASIPHEPPAGA